jgi:hypothetical protein
MINMTKATIAIAIIAALMMISGCGEQKLGTSAEIKDRGYDPVLEQRIAKELSDTSEEMKRPDYLPPEMFSRLPEFPKDFYQVRTLVRTGRITDIGSLEEKYWMQPEFFPNFEEIGVPLLAHPPKDRWGAYGIAVYPADSVSTVEKGKSLDIFFFIKSNYLVETYQGINLLPVFPAKAGIESGFQMPDGTKSFKQDPKTVESYFDITVEPNLFLLEPNFPVYNINGTHRVKVTVTPKQNTPPGNYAIGLDTADIPEEKENEWIRQHLNLYTSGGMTKIERPYYQAFIQVVESGTQ